MARPWIYLSSFSYGGKAEDCLANAKKVMSEKGFTKELDVANFKEKAKGGWVEGLLPDSPVRAVIECNGTEGITSLAVSGLDADETFKKYDQLFDSKW